jgi:hypothetical protein
MKYSILINGQLHAKDTETEMFSRGDMAFWGFSSRDVNPPMGHTLVFDLPSNEPRFVLKPYCPSCGRF